MAILVTGVRSMDLPAHPLQPTVNRIVGRPCPVVPCTLGPSRAAAVTCVGTVRIGHTPSMNTY